MRTVYLNGLFTRPETASVSVFDRGFCYGDGLFETLRTYSNVVFELGRHLDRLYGSARAIHLDLPMTRGELSQAIIETLARQERGDCMLRIAVSRGAQTAGLNIQADTAPTLVITAGPHQPPPIRCP